MKLEVASPEVLQKVFRILIETHDWVQQPSIEVRNMEGATMYVLTLETTLQKYFSYYLDFYNMTDEDCIDIQVSQIEGVKLKLRV